jgi:hypothetical protein
MQAKGDIVQKTSDFANGDVSFWFRDIGLPPRRAPLTGPVDVDVAIVGRVCADIVFMSSEARLRCPFTAIGAPPEAASTYLLPMLLGRQNAAWALLSSEWISADEAREIGLVRKVCAPEELGAVAQQHANDSSTSRPQC